MATLSLRTLTKHMRQIDICMMVTISKRGSLNSRPMSNNKDVNYKGDSWFFTYEKTRKIKDLEENPNVSLNFEGDKDLFISITGKGKIIRDKEIFEKHWVDSLSQWFPHGVDTKGMVLIHVKGLKLEYWQREKEGKIKIERN
jgi:general stress protein 26